MAALQFGGVRDSLEELDLENPTVEETAVVVDALQLLNFPNAQRHEQSTTQQTAFKVQRILKPDQPYAIVEKDNMATVLGAGVTANPYLLPAIEKKQYDEVTDVQAHISFADKSGKTVLFADGRLEPDWLTTQPLLRRFFADPQLQWGAQVVADGATAVNGQNELLLTDGQLRWSAMTALRDVVLEDGNGEHMANLRANMRMLELAAFSPEDYRNSLEAIGEPYRREVLDTITNFLVDRELFIRRGGKAEGVSNQDVRRILGKKAANLVVAQQYHRVLALTDDLEERVLAGVHERSSYNADDHAARNQGE
jgi:hypothetical protein